MSDKPNDGGPAFPTLDYDRGAAMNGIGVSVTDVPGMSLRDYFAAKAMLTITGLVADEAARRAYKIADAMLAAREAKP